MTKERAYFESLALKEEGRLSPEHVPEVYHFDRTMSLIGMRYLEPPHIILRKGLIAGIEYPFLAEHMADFMAKTLFFTSLLFRSTSDHKRDGITSYPFHFIDEGTCTNVRMYKLILTYVTSLISFASLIWLGVARCAQHFFKIPKLPLYFFCICDECV